MHIISVHICFYNDSAYTKIILDSIKQYGNIDQIVLLCTHDLDEKQFLKYSGILYSYKVVPIIGDTYSDYVNILITELNYCSNLKKEAFVNITAATPIQAFAARFATINKPTPVYAIDSGMIEAVHIPDYTQLTSGELSALKQLKIKGALNATDIEVKVNGRTVQAKSRNKTLNNLEKKKLIRFDKSIGGLNMGPGRKPRGCYLTEIGQSFCDYNIEKLKNVD